MRIVILSYYAAPESGVGGRRWRKHARYLAELGHKVTLITSDKPEDVYDEKPDGVDIVHVKTPVFQSSKRSRLGRWVHKVYYLVNLLRVRRRQLIDIFEPWAIKASEVAKQVISKKGADVVIATGHPCSVNYWTMKLQDKFSQMFVIQDFRDTWNEEVNYQASWKGLSQKSKKRSLKAEREVLAKSSLIFSVSSGQGETLVKGDESLKQKLKIIPHGYDPDDLKGANSAPPKDSIRLVHAGTIRWSAIEGFRAFLDRLLRVEDFLGQPLELIFYGTDPSSICLPHQKGLVEKKIKYKGLCPEKELLSEISASHGGLIFFDKSAGMGTKLFSYMACDKPVLSVSPAGELQEYVKANGLPWAGFNGDSIEKAFQDLAALIQKGWSWGPERERGDLRQIANDIDRVLREAKGEQFRQVTITPRI